MIDYNKIIDGETWAYIRGCEAAYPADAVDYSVAQQRAFYTRLCQSFAAPHPVGLRTQNQHVAGVPVRWYHPQDQAGDTLLVFFHGGGFVVGDLDSHDDICAELAQACGCALVAVDYRLAPEHPFPAAFDDVLAVSKAVLASHSGPIVLIGDSAGGNLAAAVAHALRGQVEIPGRIRGQMLIYPALGGDINQGSYISHAQAPMLTRADMEYYHQIYFADALQQPDFAQDTRACPLGEQDFRGLPPTRVIVAECDPLCDDGPAYVKALQAAGGDAACHIAKGLPHSFLRARHKSVRGQAAWQWILTELKSLL